jgi:hypothetical protein
VTRHQYNTAEVGLPQGVDVQINEKLVLPLKILEENQRGERFGAGVNVETLPLSFVGSQEKHSHGGAAFAISGPHVPVHTFMVLDDVPNVLREHLDRRIVPTEGFLQPL